MKETTSSEWDENKAVTSKDLILLIDELLINGSLTKEMSINQNDKV